MEAGDGKDGRLGKDSGGGSLLSSIGYEKGHEVCGLGQLNCDMCRSLIIIVGRCRDITGNRRYNFSR